MRTVTGWDADGQKSTVELDALYKVGHRVAGFYLGGPHAATSQLGTGYASKLHAAGFVILPIYVGRQQADMHGQPLRTLVEWGRTDAAAALVMLGKLRAEVLTAKITYLVLDWEGVMSTEGATYCTSFLDAEPGKNYLYRTDAGDATPGRHLWLAHPDSKTPDAARKLLGRHPYGKVEGVQYAWGDSVDYSLWDRSVITGGNDGPHSLGWYLRRAVREWRAAKHHG